MQGYWIMAAVPQNILTYSYTYTEFYVITATVTSYKRSPKNGGGGEVFLFFQD